MTTTDPEIGKSVVAAGLKTNYLDAGDGPPLLLIHGSGPGVTGYANWRLNIPSLSKKLRAALIILARFKNTSRTLLFTARSAYRWR